MKAGTCIRVQLVQGFNHYCFRFDFKSNTVFLTQRIVTFPPTLFRRCLSMSFRGRWAVTNTGDPCWFSPPPVQDQNRGILPRRLCHPRQTRGECGVRPSPVLLPGPYTDIGFMAAGKDEVAFRCP